tara:strand:- start:1189 stop:1839 length:651 start_codon:yes stop_codon:yes gene_type:complete
MKKIALIVAAGKGERMKKNTPKQFLLLKGIPVLMHTINCFSNFNEIILVLSEKNIERWKNLCVKYNFKKPHKVVFGGKTRFHSVKNGLKKLDPNSIVAIHDGVRPLVSKKLIKCLISKVEKNKGVVPVLPIQDSIRKISKEKTMAINRAKLFMVQTPQCFLTQSIQNAYKKSWSKELTDDASVFEKEEGNIITLTGERKNIKITTPQDLEMAEKLL